MRGGTAAAKHQPAGQRVGRRARLPSTTRCETTSPACPARSGHASGGGPGERERERERERRERGRTCFGRLGGNASEAPQNVRQRVARPPGKASSPRGGARAATRRKGRAASTDVSARSCQACSWPTHLGNPDVCHRHYVFFGAALGTLLTPLGCAGLGLGRRFLLPPEPEKALLFLWLGPILRHLRGTGAAQTSNTTLPCEHCATPRRSASARVLTT